VDSVRLIDNEGNQRGVVSSREALELARSLDLDLVEIAPTASPPVCRIMDYGKFKFDEAQKAKESRRKTQHVGVKEMKYRPKIGPGDFDTKTRLVERFLTEGHKVKVTIMFRGRESAHPELGAKILDRIVEKLTDIAKVESAPKLDGRNMIMVLGPDKKPKPKSDESAKPAPKSPTAQEPLAAPVVPVVPETATEEEILGIVQQEVAPSVSVDVTPEEG
jgi:translation initiation factor IF-3